MNSNIAADTHNISLARPDPATSSTSSSTRNIWHNVSMTLLKARNSCLSENVDRGFDPQIILFDEPEIGDLAARLRSSTGVHKASTESSTVDKRGFVHVACYTYD